MWESYWRRRATYPASTGIVAHFSGPSSEVGWDGNGQLKHLRYMKGTDTVRRFEFSYDAAGNRISQLDVVDIASPSTQRAVKWEYGYDWLDRLESVKKAEAATVGALGALQLVSVYSYDAADNRTEFQVPNLSNPALTETFTYSFDDADNITGISKAVGAGSPSLIETFTSDPDGNLITRFNDDTGVTVTYGWDDFNKLISVSSADSSGPTNDAKQESSYGVNGFRRKKKAKSGIVTTEYAAGLATAVAKSSADTVSYIHGHQILGFERGGEIFVYLHDGLGSVKDICRGSDGAVLQSYDYTENGEKTVTLDGGISNFKTWVGGHSVQDETADTDLYLMGHRWYSSSASGRFLSRDPIGFAGGMNLYSHANNSPVSFVDPNGLEPVSSLDRMLNLLQSSLSPLSEGQQEYLARAINAFLPQVLKKAGVDFALEDLGGSDGTTVTKNGKIYMRINSGLCPQDRAITTLHESVHVPNQKRIQAEIDRLTQTGNAFGNPAEAMWQDEIRAFKLQAVISTVLTPENDLDLRRTRRILSSILGGPSVEEQLMDSSYRPMYDRSQAIKAAQGR